MKKYVYAINTIRGYGAYDHPKTIILMSSKKKCLEYLETNVQRDYYTDEPQKLRGRYSLKNKFNAKWTNDTTDFLKDLLDIYFTNINGAYDEKSFMYKKYILNKAELFRL